MRTSIYLFLAALPLLLVACDSSPMFIEPTPEATLEPTPEVTPTPVATPTPEPVVLPAGLTPESAEHIPCTPVSGSVVDPCEPGPSVVGQPGGAGIGSYPPPEPEILDLGGYLTVGQTLHAHIVARGTYLPDTVRCLAHGESRLPPQRDSSRGARTIKCYVDVRVHEYVVGSGPSLLTVIAYVFYYLNFYEIGDYAVLPPDKENETEQEYIERIRVFHEQRLDGGEGNIEGREAMLFLGPSLDINVEAWQVMRQWRLERQDDGTVVVVHPARDDWRVWRDDFRAVPLAVGDGVAPHSSRVATAAHEARVAANGGRTRPEPDFPMLVSDGNQLTAYHREGRSVWVTRTGRPCSRRRVGCASAGRKLRRAGERLHSTSGRQGHAPRHTGVAQLERGALHHGVGRRHHERHAPPRDAAGVAGQEPERERSGGVGQAVWA